MKEEESPADCLAGQTLPIGKRREGATWPSSLPWGSGWEKAKSRGLWTWQSPTLLRARRERMKNLSPGSLPQPLAGQPWLQLEHLFSGLELLLKSGECVPEPAARAGCPKGEPQREGAKSKKEKEAPEERFPGGIWGWMDEERNGPGQEGTPLFWSSPPSRELPPSQG